MLAIITVGLIAAFTMAANSSLNLQIAQRVENTQQASLLAESAVQAAIAELIKSGEWKGEIDEPGSRLTFNRDLGLPYSTNNRTGSSPDGWAGSKLLGATHAVAAERVHLVGVGTWRNVTRTVEAVVIVPNFTVSIAANGKVSLKNTVVASLKRAEDAAQAGSRPELLGPGDLATNSSDPQAIVLDERSEVTGNVQSCGGVSVRGGSKVGGEVRNPWSQSELPVFNLAEYDPNRDQKLNFQTLPAVTGSRDLTGLTRTSSLTVNGDLKLDNALLFVDGTLNVSGGIKGTGAVLCTGSATVRGGLSLTTDDQIALLCNGDVNLLGAEGQLFQFNGLVYTRGNFTATRFQVTGAFIANGADADKGKVTLTGCRMLSTPTGAKVPLFIPRQMVLQIAGANTPDKLSFDMTDKNELTFGLFPGTIGGTRVRQGSQIFDIPWNTPQAALAHVNGPGGPGAQPEEDQWGWYDTAVLEVRKENDKYVYYLQYNPHPVQGAASYPERFEDRTALQERLIYISSLMCRSYTDGDQIGDTAEFRRNQYYPNVWRNFLNDPPPGDPPTANFDFDPNRFLKEKAKIRLAARLEY